MYGLLQTWLVFIILFLHISTFYILYSILCNCNVYINVTHNACAVLHCIIAQSLKFCYCFKNIKYITYPFAIKCVQIIRAATNIKIFECLILILKIH